MKRDQTPREGPRADDAFRTMMTGGKVFLTAGVDELPSDVKAMVTRKVS